MVNFHLRIMRDDTSVWNTFDGVHTLGSFDGDESYESLSAIVGNFYNSFIEVSNSGVTYDGNRIQITFWFGGDLMWISEWFGMRGDFRSNLPLVPVCDCTKSDLGETDHPCTPRTLALFDELQHIVAEDTNFPWKCPGCSRRFQNRQALENFIPSPTEIKDWHKLHMGVGHGRSVDLFSSSVAGTYCCASQTSVTTDTSRPLRHR